MIDLRLQEYIEWKVGNVTPIKGKYGYRVTLFYLDMPERIQQKSGFLTVKEANAARDRTVGELYSGDYIVYDNVTVKEFLEFWVDTEYKQLGKRVQTYMSFKQTIEHHIIPYIGNKKLSDLNSGHIQKLYTAVALFSVAKAQHTKTVINLAMKYAKAKKFIARNPALCVSVPKIGKRTEYHTRNIDSTKTLNLEQIKILLEASKDTPIHMPVLFNILMGLRKSEIVGLKYSDIDYVKQELHIQRQIGKAFVEAEDKLLAVGAQEIPLKTRSSNRILPIPDYVFEEILKEREKYEKNKREKGDAFQDTGYIICSPNGKVRSKDFHYQHYKRLLRENGLPDVRWHDLRSSYCTLLLNNEFNPKAVSILMGHAKEIITVDVYGDHKALMVDCTKEIDMFLEELCLSDQNDQTVDLQHFCLSVEDIMQNKCL